MALEFIQPARPILSPCPECGGEGHFANEQGSPRCLTCNGYGQVELRRGSHETEPMQDKKKVAR